VRARLKDYRSLLDDAAVEAVIISTPVQLHEEMAVAALAAGKHVLCEKPLSNSVESCRRILDAARAHKRTLAVGFNHRYYPSVKFLKRAVDDGRIGTLDHVRVFGGHDGLSNFRADWMYKGGLSGGGAMMDVGIHMTDLARFVLGEVRDVYGVATQPHLAGGRLGGQCTCRL
jgi:predicted dehydrogenase